MPTSCQQNGRIPKTLPRHYYFTSLVWANPSPETFR